MLLATKRLARPGWSISRGWRGERLRGSCSEVPGRGGGIVGGGVRCQEPAAKCQLPAFSDGACSDWVAAAGGRAFGRAGGAPAIGGIRSNSRARPRPPSGSPAPAFGGVVGAPSFGGVLGTPMSGAWARDALLELRPRKDASIFKIKIARKHKSGRGPRKPIFWPSKNIYPIVTSQASQFPGNTYLLLSKSGFTSYLSSSLVFSDWLVQNKLQTNTC